MQGSHSNDSLSNTSPIESKKFRIRLVVLLSILVMLLSITSSAFSLIIVYIHEKRHHLGYGQVNLTANSLATVASSFFAPWILRRGYLNSRQWLVFCGFCYFINVLIPALLSSKQQGDEENMPQPSLIKTIFQMLANVIGGAASGIMWVLYGLYMSQYCKKIQDNEKGSYFSISSAIINIRYIGAPLMIIIGMGYGGQRVFFILLSILALVTIPYPLFFMDVIDLPTRTQTQISEGDNESNDFSIAENPEVVSLSCVRMYFKYIYKLRHFLPLCVSLGFLLGFITSSLSHLLPDEKEKKENDLKIGIALFFYGLGNILGGLISGKLCDRINNYGIVATIGIIFGMLSCYLESMFLNFQYYSLFSASLVAFCMSFSISYIMCFLLVVCTVYFDGDGQAYAITRQVILFFCLLYQWFVRFENNSANMKNNMILQSIFTIILCMLSIFCVFRHAASQKSKREQRRYKTAEISQIRQQKKSTMEE